MAIAVIALFILPDFPETTRWLSDEERDLAMLRMTEDVGMSDATGDDTGNGLIAALTDWKVWWMALSLSSLVIALSFNAYFPTLTATLGYERTETLSVGYTLFFCDCSLMHLQPAVRSSLGVYCVVRLWCLSVFGFLYFLCTFRL